MSPILRDGDQMLVDLTVTNPRREGVYVLNYNGFLLVKRLFINLKNGTVNIKSDNEQYPDFEDVDLRNVRIIGRVIWVEKRM